jgi:hypothetical protein
MNHQAETGLKRSTHFMKTQIYESFTAFIKREDKELNGVSQEFADNNNPGWDKDRENNGCWNCSDCYGCSDCSHCYDCSDCSDCYHCYGCSDCSDCSGCSGCSHCSRCYDCYHCYHCYGCSDCSDCSGCSDCYGCSDCSDLRNARLIESDSVSENPLANIPVIPSIHQRLLDAVTDNGNKLDMGNWHTCETTHCRAGWIVTLAGVAGKKLERVTTPEFAAMQIYKASSLIRVSPVRFYEKNEVAMADIVRCAKEEASL